MSHITSFVCSIIQKAEELLSGSHRSATKWAFGFRRNNAEDQCEIRCSTQIDLHILDSIKPLKVILILTVVHLDPRTRVVKIQKSTLKLCIFHLFVVLGPHLLGKHSTTELHKSSPEVSFSFINGKEATSFRLKSAKSISQQKASWDILGL